MADRTIGSDTKLKKAIEGHPDYVYYKHNYTSFIFLVTHYRFLNLIPYRRKKTIAMLSNNKLVCYTDEIFEFLDKKLPDVPLIRTESHW